MKSSSEILNELGISYTQKGDNYIMRCVSHSHKDNNPSMSMRISDGVWKCWGCQAKGNLYTLYKQLTGNKLPFDQDYSYTTSYKNQSIKKDNGLIELTEGKEFSVFDNYEVMEFLESIGIYKEDFIFDFNVMYTYFARYKAENVEHEKNGTPFIKRILFPVFNFDGEIINMEGRTFDNGTPKVMYPKGAVSDWIFNIEKCDSSKPLVIVEGIKDLCKVWNIHKNVVSLFGGNWTENKIKLIKDHNYTDIILFIDNDSAGFEMANQFDSMFDKDFRICMSDIEGEDPNNLSLTTIKKKIDNSEEYGLFLMNNMNKYKKDEINDFW